MNSQQWFNIAKEIIPGGVNSPVRAFNSVGGTPVYFKSGKGAYVQTEDDKELIDFCCSWGPLIFGHARQEIVDEIQKATVNGTSFGANTSKEVELAQIFCNQIPEIEMVRLVSSGTEAVMASLRLARGYTNRQKILKFEGCYHGHTDQMLIASGSGAVNKPLAKSGVPTSLAADTFIAPYNDIDIAKSIIEKNSNDIAAIIIEPIAANMGLIKPEPNFLEGLREITNHYGILLIFDEVISGFRLGPTTYGHLCDVHPDLTILGKIIGGGLPMGALGGSKKIMENLAPNGAVYQAGTLSGNPVAVSASIKTIELLRDEMPYDKIDILGKKMAGGIHTVVAVKNQELHCAQAGSMFTPFFRKESVKNLSDSKSCNHKEYARFFHHMLENGFYLPPSPFEASFISTEHTEEHIDRFLSALLSF